MLKGIFGSTPAALFVAFSRQQVCEGRAAEAQAIIPIEEPGSPKIAVRR